MRGFAHHLEPFLQDLIGVQSLGLNRARLSARVLFGTRAVLFRTLDPGLGDPESGRPFPISPVRDRGGARPQAVAAAGIGFAFSETTPILSSGNPTRAGATIPRALPLLASWGFRPRRAPDRWQLPEPGQSRGRLGGREGNRGANRGADGPGRQGHGQDLLRVAQPVRPQTFPGWLPGR